MKFPVSILLLVGAGSALAATSPSNDTGSGVGAGPLVTYNKQIAPIIYRNCAPCHHGGESTPFDLVTYSDVAKRARQIAEVTGARYMPPWPPVNSAGYPAFVGERRLRDSEIQLISRWVKDGALEGTPDDLPPTPKWPADWQLGAPDLVVEMEKPYNLAADGKDVYRNFVIPGPVSERRYVRAIEFRPETKAAHHVFIKTDLSRQSRLRATADAMPGFPGPMAEPAVMPPGQFLTWQPGKRASVSPDGMPWVLDPEADLVLEAHLRPTGRVEPIRFKVGFYFTNQPPERTAYRLILSSMMIDIPPGASNYPVETSFRLPVDCEALAVLPHCHLLGREGESHAELPDGSTIPLLSITNWDFNWQGDYRYQTPVKIPKGAILRMQFIYDNSTNNARNPNIPPARIRYGPSFSDEMAEVSFLLLPERDGDEKILDAAYQKNEMQNMTTYAEAHAAENPGDASAQLKLGMIRMAQHRTADARAEIERAIQLDPNVAQAHYYAGLIARVQKRLPDASSEFKVALRLNPLDGKAWGNLGFVEISMGDIKGARTSLKRALEIDSTLTQCRSALEEISKSNAGN